MITCFSEAQKLQSISHKRPSHLTLYSGPRQILFILLHRDEFNKIHSTDVKWIEKEDEKGNFTEREWTGIPVSISASCFHFVSWILTISKQLEFIGNIPQIVGFHEVTATWFRPLMCCGLITEAVSKAKNKINSLRWNDPQNKHKIQIKSKRWLVYRYNCHRFDHI